MPRVFIDTEIWSFALKKPRKNAPEDEKKRFILAHHFLTERITNDEIVLTTHQVAEIFHVLSFRGKKLPTTFTRSYIEHLLLLPNVSVIPISKSHLEKAMALSQDAGIHVWDFLCVVPLVKQIEIIYSCDKHMQSELFQTFKIPVQNPLNVWLNL